MLNKSQAPLVALLVLWPCLVNAQEAEHQPLHLCASPRVPIENDQLLAAYDLTVRDEYYRYFDELNAYLMCLQKSQADAIEKARGWHERYQKMFGDG